MIFGNWNEVKYKLERENEKIFKDYDITNLNDYEKRQIIFNYLSNKLDYDYDNLVEIFLIKLKKIKDIKEQKELLKDFCNKLIIYNDRIDAILNNKINTTINGRNPYQELEKVIDYNKGICNSISQYYKLLLELNGIYSVCVICDNKMPVKHQINLVYDKTSDTYSFDDVTSAILNKSRIQDYFNYDVEMAKELDQGILPVDDSLGNSFGIILPTSFINFLVGRDDDTYKKYGLEIDEINFLPDNISPCKNEKVQNRI